MIKKVILIFLVCLVVVLSYLAIVNINSKEKNNLKQVTVAEVAHSVFYAPQYAAISEGFFEEYGIEIDLTTSQGADAVMTSVLSNQCEIGFAGPEASIYVYNEGKEDYTEVFAQLTKKDGAFLVAREKTDNFS